jgi:hypothetical protein
MRAVLAASLVALGCGRSQGVPDRDLGGLVVASNRHAPKIDVDRATTDPGELGSALALPHHEVAALLGVHTVAIAMATHVTENGKPVTDLDDKTSVELGAKGTFHAIYTNSADYGRETTFVGGVLYLRPRYQRWHQRAPETPDEPTQLADQFYDPIVATWELLAPGVELTDKGPAQVAGRAGRKIEVKPAPSPKQPAAEPLAQRKWRETRTIDALTGEVVLDAETGVPLAVKLSGTIGFTRDGRRFAMQVSVQSDVTAIGQPAAIATPSTEEVVATPERLREVDDRDYLLQGIAPSSHHPAAKAPDAGKPKPTDAPKKPEDKKSLAKPSISPPAEASEK